MNPYYKIYDIDHSKNIRDLFLSAIIETDPKIPQYEYQNFPTKKEIEKNPVFESIIDWLKNLECKSVVIEFSYVDLEYQEDFARSRLSYFPHIHKNCKRLHFFSEELKEEFFDPKENYEIFESLQRSYLGFCIIKPLPYAFFGKTCLKVKKDVGNFIIAEKFEANLFGIKFAVNAMPFQEQDQEIGLCASSAIWFTLQITSKLFKNSLAPSISQITLFAKSCLNNFTYPFPADGLTIKEIRNAIQNSNLRTELFEIKEGSEIRQLVYCYEKYKIPLMIELEITDSSGKSQSHHAATIVGFKYDNQLQKGGIPLKADYISKFIIHDDQRGPYIECPIEQYSDTKLIVTNDLQKFFSFSTSDKILIKSVIIPLNAIIRIKFSFTLKDVISRFHLFLNNIFLDLLLVKNKWWTLDWDFYLIDIANLRNKIMKSELAMEIKNRIIQENAPKYSWRCVGYLKQIIPHSDDVTIFEKEDVLIEIHVDATGQVHPSSIYRIIIYDNHIEVKNVLISRLKENHTNDLKWERAFEQYSDFLAKKIHLNNLLYYYDSQNDKGVYPDQPKLK